MPFVIELHDKVYFSGNLTSIHQWDTYRTLVLNSATLIKNRSTANEWCETIKKKSKFTEPKVLWVDLSLESEGTK